MKKTLLLILSVLILLLGLSGCSEKTSLSPDDPVTLTMWHVYGEQVDSPMNRLVDEFNETVGHEKGIIIDVTLMSNASEIGEKLTAAQSNTPGLPDMPDLFFCHAANAASLGVDNLVDWNDYFTEDEIDNYIPEFLVDGIVDDKLVIFPVAKSTLLLFVSGSQFDRFSAETGVTYGSLDTWDGFFSASEKYYEWSGGKPFCAVDYPIVGVELNALSKGAGELYTEDGWYDFNNEIFRQSWYDFADALVKGHIIVSDLYSNTQIMTGEVISGIGSCASILYYNDTITYPDNSSEPVDLQVLPFPQAKGGNPLISQSGVGLCAYKTDERRAEAESVFAHWLTEGDRNLDFAAQTGYVPVNKASFESLDNYEFSSDAYKQLYTVLGEESKTATALRMTSQPEYYRKLNLLYSELRANQTSYAERYKSGESADALVSETWELFKAIR